MRLCIHMHKSGYVNILHTCIGINENDENQNKLEIQLNTYLGLFLSLINGNKDAQQAQNVYISFLLVVLGPEWIYTNSDLTSLPSVLQW